MNRDDCLPADRSPASFSIRGTEEIRRKKKLCNRYAAALLSQECWFFKVQKSTREAALKRASIAFSRAGFPHECGAEEERP